MTCSCTLQEGSPEKFLYEHCRIPEDQVDVVMTTATAWRVTPGGRPLIDRRRRSRVARNVVLVAEYLEKLDIPAGELSQRMHEGMATWQPVKSFSFKYFHSAFHIKNNGRRLFTRAIHHGGD